MSLDLASILAKATAAAEQAKRLKAEEKKPVAERDPALQAAIDAQQWTPTGWVARIKVIPCGHCGRVHQRFDNWYTAYDKKGDRYTKRFLVGRKPGTFAMRTELVTYPPTEHCHECVADWIKRRQSLVVVGGTAA